MTIIQQAFSNALFHNRNEVNIMDIRSAIKSSKNIYPDVIEKSLPLFDDMFSDQINEYNVTTNANYEKLSEDKNF